MNNKILTYPLGNTCNLAHHHKLTLIHSNELFEKSIKDDIQNNIIFLSAIDISLENSCEDQKRILSIFMKLQKNNFCIIFNDHKTNIDLFANHLKYYVETTKINQNKIFIVLYLPSEVENLKNKLLSFGLDNISITYKMNWLLWAKQYFTLYEDILPSYRFSIFSRRFSDWRFYLYTQLLENNILDKCIHTFSESHPDFPGSEIPKEDLKKNIPKHFLQQQKISDWIDLLPICFNDHTWAAVSDIIYRKLQMSYFHIVCETHVDSNDHGVTLTEKIYKPILAGKPFLVVGQKDILKLLRAQGFKTFHPIIDESYDDIEDSYARIDFVCLELKKLNELPLDDFIKMINSCQDIIQHNLRLVEHFSKEDWPIKYKKLNIFG